MQRAQKNATRDRLGAGMWTLYNTLGVERVEGQLLTIQQEVVEKRWGIKSMRRRSRMEVEQRQNNNVRQGKHWKGEA